MAESTYPDDVQFADLVQAATAAADEHAQATTGRRGQKRTHDDFSEHGGQRSQLAGTGRPAADGQEDSTLQSSAAVLFREPSEKSKKYSRPPLGKVYSSLELAPETFLRLQGAAKAFMLDDQAPVRRDVVGHKRNSSNNDVTKLKLWHCVEDFLHSDNNGETFFGPDAGSGIPDTPPRTFWWPQDSHKIVKLCMPLLRKMVTNERQRVYAADTRRQTPAVGNESHSNAADGLRAVDVNHATTPDEPTAAAVGSSTSVEAVRWRESRVMSKHTNPSPSTSGGPVAIHVNIVTYESGAARRRAPRFTVAPEAATDLPSLLREVERQYQTLSGEVDPPSRDWAAARIKVWLPDGLVQIEDDGQWMVALLSAGRVDWMDGEVRVLIEP